MTAFSTIKPDDVLYSVTRGKMGNTTISETRVHAVRVIEVDATSRKAFVSWNSNAPRWWGERELAKLRRTRPAKKS